MTRPLFYHTQNAYDDQVSALRGGRELKDLEVIPNPNVHLSARLAMVSGVQC